LGTRAPSLTARPAARRWLWPLLSSTKNFADYVRS